MSNIVLDVLVRYGGYLNYLNTHTLVFNESGDSIQILGTPPTSEAQQKILNFYFRFFKQAALTKNEQVLKVAQKLSIVGVNKELQSIFDKAVGTIRLKDGKKRDLPLRIFMSSPLIVSIENEGVFIEEREDIFFPIDSCVMDNYILYSKLGPYNVPKEKMSDILAAISCAHFLGDDTFVEKFVGFVVFDSLMLGNIDRMCERFNMMVSTCNDNIFLHLQDLIAGIIQRNLIIGSSSDQIQSLKSFAGTLGLEGCSHIYTIKLDFCNLSLEVLENVADAFPNLKHLDLRLAYRDHGFIIPLELRARFKKISE